MDLIEARNICIEQAASRESELVSLEKAAGRVLAEPVSALRDLPGECRSRLDGYALRSEDTQGEPPGAVRIVSGTIAAGHPAFGEIGPGECIRILTGATLPPGADAVLAQECARRERDGMLLPETKLAPWSGVALAGEEVRKGETLLLKGDILTPTRLAIAAALGNRRISVFRRPRVALLATGDEVRELDSTADGFSVFCNNSFLLGRLAELQGAIAVSLGVRGDDPLALAGRLNDVDAEVVITTGGVGRGDRDFVIAAWNEIGVKQLFYGLNLSPGKNSAAGRRQSQIFFGLPGNPWGAQLIFEELIAPVLRKLQGIGEAPPLLFPARLEATLKKAEGAYKAFRGAIRRSGDMMSFTPSVAGRSISLAVMRESFAYTLLGPHVVEVPEGSVVDIHLHDFPVSAFAPFGFL